MSSEMPRGASEEAVARWLYDNAPKCVLYDYRHAKSHARAVLAWAEERAREAVRDATLTLGDTVPMCRDDEDTIIARVFGREEVRDA